MTIENNKKWNNKIQGKNKKVKIIKNRIIKLKEKVKSENNKK